MVVVETYYLLAPALYYKSKTFTWSTVSSPDKGKDLHDGKMQYLVQTRQRKGTLNVPVCVCVCIYIYIYIFFLDATLASPHLSVMVRRRSITQIQCIVHCPLAEPMKDESTWK